MNALNYNMTNNYGIDTDSENMDYLYLSDIEKEYKNKKSKSKKNMKGGDINYDTIPSGGFPPIYELTKNDDKPKRDIKQRRTSISIKDILNATK